MVTIFIRKNSGKIFEVDNILIRLFNAGAIVAMGAGYFLHIDLLFVAGLAIATVPFKITLNDVDNIVEAED